jgi:hypothetical protein
MDKYNIINLLTNINVITIRDFCQNNGAREVHRSWRNNMQLQERSVSEERMSWDTLSDKDKELDARISEEVIWDFLVWAMDHPH